MTFKDFSEQAEIVYNLSVTVNDDDTIDLASTTEAGLLEQLRKVDKAIADKLQEQWDDLPENQESEEE